MSTQTTRKFDKRIIHLIIAAIIVIGSGHVPPVSTLTPFGMQALGAFLGMIYGWIFVDMLWTSLMMFFLVPFTGLLTMDEYIIAGFGNTVVMQVCFITMLMSIIADTDVAPKLANRILAMKICEGRPWVFFGALVFATYLISYVAGGVVGLILMMGILNGLMKTYNIAPYSKTATLIIIGILIPDCLGQMCLPVRGMPLILLSLYQTFDPSFVTPVVSYIVFTTVFTILICLIVIVFFKYVLRLDLSMFANIDTSVFASEKNKFTKKDKISMIIAFGAMLLLVLQSSFPSAAVKSFLGAFGFCGLPMLAILLVLMIKADGEPIATMPQLARGMSWDILLTVASTQPLLAFVSSDDAGVKAMLSSLLEPIVSHLSPLVFVLFIMIICAVLTNFLNNMPVCLMLYPIVMLYAPSLGLSVTGLISMLIIVSHLAFATPAASFYSLIAFGYTDWIKSSTMMKYCFILLLPLALSAVLIGYVLVPIIF